MLCNKYCCTWERLLINVKPLFLNLDKFLTSGKIDQSEDWIDICFKMEDKFEQEEFGDMDLDEKQVVKIQVAVKFS